MHVQLEVAFDSIAELEGFWAAIPPERHRAWSQRAQHVIIDGSPQVLMMSCSHIGVFTASCHVLIVNQRCIRTAAIAII